MLSADPVLLPADEAPPRPGSGRACGRRFQPAEKRTEPPSLTSVIRRVEAAIADSSRSSSGPFGPFGKNRRHLEAKNAERAVDAQSF